MAQRLVFHYVYPVAREVLATRLERVLTEIDGVTLIRMEADGTRAILQTGVTWSSWGQNMIATVEELAPFNTRLTVTGQVRHIFCSSGWGERFHARWFARQLNRALAPWEPIEVRSAGFARHHG